MDNFCEIGILLEMLTYQPQNIYAQIIGCFWCFVVFFVFAVVVGYFSDFHFIKSKFPLKPPWPENVVW